MIVFLTHVLCSLDMVLVGAEGVVENGGIINKFSMSLAQTITQETRPAENMKEKGDSMN